MSDLRVAVRVALIKEFNLLLINPFDTEPMAKIAVKISIIRVVKFMSSPGNDFTS